MFSCQEEHDIILRNKGDNKKLDWNDYTSMKFTQCVSKILLFFIIFFDKLNSYKYYMKIILII